MPRYCKNRLNNQYSVIAKQIAIWQGEKVMNISLRGWDEKPRTMQRYLKRGDIFCFVYDDNRYCFGRIIEIKPKRFCIAEIFDYTSDTPTIDEKTIENAVRIIPPVNIDAYILFDCKAMGGDWRIIGHQEDYYAPDYDDLFIGWGLEGDWKKEDMRGNMTKASKEEHDKSLPHIQITDYTIKELLKDFYGERQVRKTADDIRKAIGVVKYGLKEYLEAVDEVADFDVNDLDKYKRNLLQLAILEQKWDVAIDLIKRKIDVNNQDDKGRTALHYLCAKPINVELVEAVLKAGGDPNLQSNEKLSPLYEIVSCPNNKYANERYQIIELLLNYGGDKALPCRNGRTAEEVVEIIGDLKAIALLKKYAPIRTVDEDADPEMRYQTIMDEIKIMLGEKEITDEEIWKKISETPEIIKMRDKRSSGFLFLLTIPHGRLKLAKMLAENGADVHEESTLPFYNGNALNGATTAEMVEWLLSLGLKMEKNLVLEPEERTTPYVNPAVNAAGRNDARMMRFWLTKEKELFADEQEYLEELFEKTISVAAKVNQNTLLEFIIRDEELYPYLKKDYSDGTGWNAKVSAKLRKQSLKLIEAEELKPQVKELTKILTQRAKETKL